MRHYSLMMVAGPRVKKASLTSFSKQKSYVCDHTVRFTNLDKLNLLYGGSISGLRQFLLHPQLPQKKSLLQKWSNLTQNNHLATLN
jgi:hypothetical protein